MSLAIPRSHYQPRDKSDTRIHAQMCDVISGNTNPLKMIPDLPVVDVILQMRKKNEAFLKAPPNTLIGTWVSTTVVAMPSKKTSEIGSFI